MAKSKIIKELANNEISLEVALNRLLIIASDLNNDELSNWVEAELHGYKKGDALPAYRVVQSLHFTYSGINGSFQVTNSPFTYLSIITRHDPDAVNVRLTDSISALQAVIDTTESHSYYKDFTYLSGYVYEATGIHCTRILQKVPQNIFQNVFSEIKTRLLKVLLKLDKEYGCLDDLDVDTSDRTPDEVAEINKAVNNYIYIDNSVTVGDRNKIEGSEILTGGS